MGRRERDQLFRTDVQLRTTVITEAAGWLSGMLMRNRPSGDTSYTMPANRLEEADEGPIEKSRVGTPATKVEPGSIGTCMIVLLSAAT